MVEGVRVVVVARLVRMVVGIVGNCEVMRCAGRCCEMMRDAGEAGVVIK